ncbi:MAG TPA: dihydropteroate synthase [Acidimicrobiia bacterium]|jgi:dihydropteroate synthase
MPVLRCRDRTIDVRRPLVMGVVNATPDSFSDGGDLRSADEAVARARALVDDGAEVIDIGGQSAITGVPEISVPEEIDRVLPVVAGVRAASNCMISVDTYRAAVAAAVLDAGADVINDVSGVIDPDMPDLVARTGAGLVVMHTRWRPKTRTDARALYQDVEGGVVADVVERLRTRRDELLDAGVASEQLILDPGPDFSKTAAQTVAVLRSLDAVTALGRPLLLALSRKDFVGVITGRPPRERLAGTLAALAFACTRAPASIVRVHDVAQVRDFFAVLDVLEARAEVDEQSGLAANLRWDARVAPAST